MTNQTASFCALSCSTWPSKTLQKGSVCWLENNTEKLLLHHSHQTYCNNAFLRNTCSLGRERKTKPRKEEVSRVILAQAHTQQKKAEKSDWAASRRSAGGAHPEAEARRERRGHGGQRPGGAQAAPSCLSDRGYSHWDASWRD